jgi:cell filamentation protein
MGEEIYFYFGEGAPLRTGISSSCAIYEWAGDYRTVRIAKGDTMFCQPENIPSRMELVFDGLEGGVRFRHQGSEEFVTSLGAFFAELNAIHPFREGNGRTQLAFSGLIGEAFGRPLHFERIDHERFLSAMVVSFAGDLKPLIAELRLLRQ